MKNPIFQYFGSKFEFADKIISYFPKHHTFIDVCGGAGSIILQKIPSAVEVFNDIDKSLINFFKVCRQQPEELARLIALTPYSRSEWEIAKNVDNIEDELERARLFVVLLRQSRSGSPRQGWSKVIGHSRRDMASSCSRWLNVPDVILEVANRFKTIQIECKPALEIIKEYDKNNVLMYIDPPYLLENKENNAYRFGMTDEQHEEILETAMHCKAKIVISGYHSILYDNKLKSWKTVELNVHCRSNVSYDGTIGNNPYRTEVLWIKD